MKIRTHVKNSNSKWTEDYIIGEEIDAEKYVKDMINNFNNTLHKGENPREVEKIEILDELVLPMKKHIWEKQNMVTIVGKGIPYDKYKCTECGVTGKRFGLSPNVIRDSKFEALKYAHCISKKE